MHHMQAVSDGGQKRVSDPWNWKNIWLRAVLWVVGIKPGSSRRAASALKHWAMSLAPHFCYLYDKTCHPEGNSWRNNEDSYTKDGQLSWPDINNWNRTGNKSSIWTEFITEYISLLEPKLLISKWKLVNSCRSLMLLSMWWPYNRNQKPWSPNFWRNRQLQFGGGACSIRVERKFARVQETQQHCLTGTMEFWVSRKFK